MQRIVMAFTVIVAVLMRISGPAHHDRIIYFDIGQGDSALIQIGDFDILIDGGPTDEVVYKLGKYMPFVDRTIELMILTHPHADHISGLVDVQERYEVDVYVYNPVCYRTDGYTEFVEAAAGKGIAVDKIEINEDATLYILYPISFTRVGNPDDEICHRRGKEGWLPAKKNINNDSVVVLLTYDGENYLFMGDAEKELESELLASGVLDDITRVNVLKAGHHCSNTSSTERFLDQVHPDMAVCSVGENNDYGHPGKKTVDLFARKGIPYAITWQTGDVVVEL